MAPVIECVELSKAYGRHVTALSGVTLRIERGDSFALLGENGAGKSTLVRILMGFIFPTSGHVSVLGEKEVVRAHPRIGYIHERPIFEPTFSGRSYLTYMAQLSGLWGEQGRARVDALLTQIDLQEASNRGTRTYSKGMLQRLAIAQALLTEPELLILDEPTSGLDPRSQWEIRQVINGLHKQGITILLCSHYLAEVEALCNAVGILRHGELILSGSVNDLLRSQGLVEIALAHEQSAQEIMARLQLTDRVISAEANLLRIPDKAQAEVLAALVAAGVPITALNPVNRTLEEVYVRATEMAKA